jgi:pimeloyl-ACP methyl ester carboxylesterase
VEDAGSASPERHRHEQPIVIGHSFGGLLAQIIAGRGLALASVAMAKTARAFLEKHGAGA